MVLRDIQDPGSKCADHEAQLGQRTALLELRCAVSPYKKISGIVLRLNNPPSGPALPEVTLLHDASVFLGSTPVRLEEAELLRVDRATTTTADQMHCIQRVHSSFD